MNTTYALSMAAILVGGVIAPATSALADVRAGAVPGSRVRVTIATADPDGPIAHDRTLMGTLVGFDGTALELRTDNGGKTLVLSREQLSRLEVSRGTHGQSARWAGIGFVAGFLIGLPMGAAAGSDEFIGSSGQWALAGGVSLGLLGALVGAGLGAAQTVERWEPVPLKPQTAGRRTTRPGNGARVALQMRF